MKVSQRKTNQVIKAMTNGPELRKFKLSDHKFNVKKARISRSSQSGIMTVEGRISHHLKFRPDDQFDYKFTIEPGKPFNPKNIKIDIKGFMDSALFKIGKNVLNLLSKKWPKLAAINELRQLNPKLKRLTTDSLKSLAKQLDDDWEDEAMYMVAALSLSLSSKETIRKARITSRVRVRSIRSHRVAA